MHTAIITVPNAFLFENPTGKSISDELLSGWVVTIQKQQNNFLKVTTHYGYTGWLNASAVRSISQKEYSCWNLRDFWNRESMQENHASRDSEQPKARLAILRRGITDILREPKVQACILSTLFMGSAALLVDAPQNGWQKIKTAEGICGYVPSVSLLYADNKQQTPIHAENSLQKQPDANKWQTQMQLRFAILNYAKSYLGAQYRWGGKTHAGIDCSGLAFMSYYMCGILIYRDAAIADGYPVQEIPFSQIQPADLIYFPGHVALYLGNGRYIHATGNPASFGCVINSLNPQDPDYREDLADSITAVGSVFS